MVLLSDLKPFKIDYSNLPGQVYYFWMMEYILSHFVSEEYIIELIPNSPQSEFGAHWGGFLIALKDKEGNRKAFCHAGLVYHPGTEVGIYAELESWSNAAVFQKIWRDVEPASGFDLNKEESDFLKFFFRKDQLGELMNAGDVNKQMDMLTKFLDAFFNAVLKAVNK